MITSRNTVLKLTASHPSDGLFVKLFANDAIAHAKYEIKNASGKTLAYGEIKANGNNADANVKFDAEYWSLSTPTLYLFTLNIQYISGEMEEISDRFGFRTLSSDENYIYLNGYPFYMRAYIRGCSAHEHQNNCRLSEYEFYKKNILMAKSYGFNAIRFHSVVPSEECFRAADELGILIHIEMRAEKAEYKNLHEMIYGKNDFISLEDLDNIINSLYNHPSLMVYCVGNEIRSPGTKPRIREIRDYIKEKDPTRLFLDTCADGEYDRDYVDLDVQHMSYFYPYGRHSDMFSNTDMLLDVKPLNPNANMVEKGENSTIKRKIYFNRPMLAHEVTHYTAWRDFYALKEKFKKYGVEAPWWVDEEIKMIEAKGYAENYKETQQVTKNFQFRCWKTAFERIRLSKLLCGFHMLQFADTDKYENSNGVVDCFDDPHGTSAEEFRKFNGDTVILAELDERIYSGGDDVRVGAILSCYTINPPKAGNFSFNLKDGEKIISEGKLDYVETSRSGIYELCSVEFKMPEVSVGKKLILEFKLELCDGKVIENDWELWVFPSCEEKKIAAKLDMREDYLCRTVENDNASDLIITDKLDDNMFEALDEGKNVLLIYRQDWTRHLLHKDMSAPKYSFRAVWERYKGVIWDRGTLNGGIDNKALLEKHGFPTDGEINYQYYNLIEDSDKINLDDFPFANDSIVSGLDKSSRDRFDPEKFGERELMYDRTMRHFSYAFALNAGRGKLMVTGFNFTSLLKNDPSAHKMLDALVNILSNSEFTQKTSIDTKALKSYLSDVASKGPQKEGMMTQYWQLDEEPFETMEYWLESERYLREGNNLS